MKKLGFLTLAATALFMTGCSDDFGRPGGDGDGTVTFAVALPGQVTRAFSDGDNANKLYCLVYSDGKFVTATKELDIQAKTATVQLELAKGVEYDIVFWASNEESTTVVDALPEELPTAYTIDKSTGDLKINYAKIESNDDKADAFYATKHFRGGDPKPTETISLTRPFAQINIGATDLNEEVVKKAYNNGVFANLTYQAYTAMNLVRKTVNEGDIKDIETKIALSPSSEEYPVDADKTKYTNMAYALVSQEITNTMNVTCNFYTSDKATTPTTSRPFGAVPLKANYRTNIYGALLTSDTDFNITVDPAFTLPSNDNPPSVLETTAAFKEMLADKSFEGKTTDVVLQNGLTENVTVNADVPTTLNLDFNNKPMTATLTAGPNVTLNIKNTVPANEGGAAARRRSMTPGTTGSGEAYCELFVAESGATISIYDGYYRTNKHVVARANGGTINIYGGHYWATNTADSKVVLNNGGHINVYGGYFRSQYAQKGEISLATMGIYPDPACKVTKHSDDDLARLQIWYQVEKVWHPGIDLATLEWENVGTAQFKDPWMRATYRYYNDNEGTSYDFENFADLPVTIQRCKTYPTLYKIVNPYINAPRIWFNRTDTWLAEKIMHVRNGEIIFDMHDPSCVTVVPNVYSGGTYYWESDDQMKPHNLEGSVYYNLRNEIKGDVATSLETIKKYTDFYTDDKRWAFNDDLTHYDKNTRTLHFRNALFDIIGEDGTEYYLSYYGFGNSDTDWRPYHRGHLIFPENFVLLDVYGNPVK